MQRGIPIKETISEVIKSVKFNKYFLIFKHEI